MAKEKKDKDSQDALVSGTKKEAKGKKPSRRRMNRKTRKTLTSVICVVLVIGIAFAYVATGAIRGGIISYFQIPQKTLSGAVIEGEDGQEIKVTPGQYNYYFSNVYYSYYQLYAYYSSDSVDFDKALSKQTYTDDDGNEMTWLEFLEQETLDSIKSVEVFYAAAVEENDGEEPELTEEQQEEIDEELAEYKESAESYGFTLNAYLKKVVGRGVNEELMRTEMKKSYIASDYQTQIQEAFESQDYDDAMYDEYYEENAEDMANADFRVFSASSEDDAEEMLERLKDGEDFTDLAAEYAEDGYYTKAYGEASKSTEKFLAKVDANVKYSALSDEELDWIYSEEREAGDMDILASTYVVMIMKPAYVSNVAEVNVRHILISPETDDDADVTDATDEQWADALEKAQSILEEWEQGDKTEDSFGELAKKNTEDTASSDTGGLIEGIYPGEMVSEFNYWIFDNRNAGDTEIVRTDYGYHIIYFVSSDSVPYWKTLAKTEFTNNDTTDAVNAVLDTYSLDVKWLGSKFFNDDVSLTTQ